MKTAQEIIDSYESNDEYPSYYHESSIELMMKEYAKMWVEEAVFWAEKQSEYGAPIINEVLPRIQKRIDEQ